MYMMRLDKSKEIFVERSNNVPGFKFYLFYRRDHNINGSIQAIVSPIKKPEDFKRAFEMNSNLDGKYDDYNGEWYYYLHLNPQLLKHEKNLNPLLVVQLMDNWVYGEPFTIKTIKRNLSFLGK